MKYKSVVFSSDDKKSVHRFLHFPSKLYPKKQRMQNPSTEKALLSGTHILSHYFTVYPFLLYDNDNKVAGRCILTVYPESPCAYIGFFECINDSDAAKCIFDEAEAFAKKLGCNSVVGPVDASFWIRYRLKTNAFDKNPYTGEPYNLPYYEQFFIENGFSVSGEYISNRYGKIPQSFLNNKNIRRIQHFSDCGYSICSLSAESFEKSLHDIYKMLIHVYSDFQTFSYITEDEFCELYSSMKYIADYDMVKIAYYKEKPVGFFVTLPNYGSASSGNMTLSNLWHIHNIKNAPDDYILLYLGIEPEHLGLGKALSEDILRQICQKQAFSIGALVRKGKVTGSYFSKLIEEQYTYALYEKNLMQ